MPYSTKYSSNTNQNFDSTGNKCRLYSAVVSQYWNPEIIDDYNQDLNEFNCFSSWVKRDDVVGRGKATGSNFQGTKFPTNVIDGYYCLSSEKFNYHSHTSVPIEETYLEVELEQAYPLKCVRVPTRDLNFIPFSNFHDVEFRFGNMSQWEDYKLNPVVGIVEGEVGNRIVEICPDFLVVGRYLGLRLLGERYLCVGEIQITVR